MLIIVAICCVLLGIRNLVRDTFLHALIFFNSGLMLALIPINKRGKHRLVGLIVSIAMYILITYSLYDGIGLRDAGMLGYVGVIILVAFLLTFSIEEGQNMRV